MTAFDLRVALVLDLQPTSCTAADLVDAVSPFAHDALNVHLASGAEEFDAATLDVLDVPNAIVIWKDAPAIANGAPVSAKIGRLRFDDAAADLETDYSINKRRTLEHVQRHVKRLTKHFGGRRMTDITGAEVRRYIATRQEAARRTQPSTASSPR